MLRVLLTHLQLDHIQGLMFFAPFFDPEVEITVWGPPAAGHACASASPATSPTRSHRGPTLGYRLTENATSLCYLPDHEPAGARPPRPWHDDAFRRSLEREASERWTQLGGAGPVALGREGDAFDLGDMAISPHGRSELVA
jgi:glyoxylase-like metal-dependent hydrolase (beta-lactamase superfamily II)